eukprot:1845952-Rhodomonas_salina.2
MLIFGVLKWSPKSVSASGATGLVGSLAVTASGPRGGLQVGARSSLIRFTHPLQCTMAVECSDTVVSLQRSRETLIRTARYHRL